MKSRLLFCLLQCCITLIALGQTTGDYRSLGTPTWAPIFYDGIPDPVPSWERFDGNSWIATLQSPTAADGVITIRYGHEKFGPSDIIVDQLVVEAGGTLNGGPIVGDGPGDDLIVNGTLNLGSLFGPGTVVVNGTMNWHGGIIDAHTVISSTGLLEVFYTWDKCHLGDLNDHTSLIIHGAMKGTGEIYFNNAEIINYGVINSNFYWFFSADPFNDLFWNKPGAIFNNNPELSNGGINIGVPTLNEGTLNGTGYIYAGTATNTGIVSPGHSGNTGILTLGGSLGSFLENSTLNIEIKDGSGQHDQLLSYEFDIILGGTLNVTEIAQNIPNGDYVIIRHNSFGQISGQFSSVNLPSNYCILYNEPEEFGVAGRNVVLRKGSINYYPDLDGDGYGDPNAHPLLSCTAPLGYSKFNIDCDDTDPNVTYPSQFYPDADGDGYGANVVSESFCIQPPGYVNNHDDCDDTNPDYHQTSNWWPDNDGDGYGNKMGGANYCVPPDGFVNNNNDCNDADPAITDQSPDKDNDGFTICEGDCNDNDPTVHPGAQDLCFIDKNCDGFIYDVDSDNDNDGFTSCQGDCNDEDAAIHPEAIEICNGLDDDCDNLIDENTVYVNIPDAYAVTPGGKANTIYLGYGPSSLTLTTVATAGSPNYTYSWYLGASHLGNAQSLTVSPGVVGSYSYKVIVTGAVGCTAEFTKTIQVEDIWSDKKKTKVYVCHRDSRGTWAQVSILTGSVTNHLAHGDYLGICNNNSSSTEVLTRAANETDNSELISEGFKIYPNPATHFLDVQWTTTNTSQSTIRILNAEGRVVKTLTTKGSVNNQRISLNGLAKGVYMLVLKTGADQQVSKFVIQ